MKTKSARRRSRTASGWRSLKRNGWSGVLPSLRRIFRLDGSLSKRQRRIRNTRTKEALAEARARGVKLGRPSGISSELRERIREMRDGGMTLQKIATTLNDEAVPPAQAGRKWWPGTVAQILKAAK